MPRILGKKIHERKIYDAIGEGDITFYYRLPTTNERIKYNANLFAMRGANKLQNKSFETRLEMGLAIVTGFKEGDFVVEKEGKLQPISSQQNSPNYYADWKNYLREETPELVVALAALVFDAASTSAPEMESEGEAIDVGEERKNS